MEENLKTCLYDRHIALGAQMSPFAGFIMPIQYSSITEEHNAVRQKAGMFDVSHMGEIFVSGKDAARFVNFVFSNDISQMPQGKVLYGMLLNSHGGVVDDLLVYREFSPQGCPDCGENYLLVVNASNIAKDYAWLVAQSEGFDVKVDNRSSVWGEIALQGPQAEDYAVAVLSCTTVSFNEGKTMEEVVRELGFYTYAEFQRDGERIIVSRTGYTGEDGFEIYGSHRAIVAVWDKLLEMGVTPCGLGCRDTLRFEAGLPLYGHELTDDISPVEAGLGMFVKLDKPDFIGKDATAVLKAAGLSRKLVGIELQDKAIPRAGYPVEADGRQIGTVTTGYRSISTDRSVCVAMVEMQYAALDTPVEVRIRKKTFPGKVTKKRFYDTHYKK